VRMTRLASAAILAAITCTASSAGDARPRESKWESIEKREKAEANAVDLAKVKSYGQLAKLINKYVTGIAVSGERMKGRVILKSSLQFKGQAPHDITVKIYDAKQRIDLSKDKIRFTMKLFSVAIAAKRRIEFIEGANNLPGLPGHIGVWSTGKGKSGNAGIKKINLVLKYDGKVIDILKDIVIEQKTDKVPTVSVPLPETHNGKIDGFRIELITPTARNSGLYEVQINCGKRNFARQCIVTASGCHSDKYAPDFVIDGITGVGQPDAGFWMPPVGERGWIELSGKKKRR